MKATRHNGRSGKHGTYDAKHNDHLFRLQAVSNKLSKLVKAMIIM